MKFEKVAVITISAVLMHVPFSSAWAQAEPKTHKNSADAPKAAPKKPGLEQKANPAAHPESHSKSTPQQTTPANQVPPQQDDEEDEEIE